MSVSRRYCVSIFDKNYKILVNSTHLTVEDSDTDYSIDCLETESGRYSLLLDGKSYSLTLEQIQEGVFTANINGKEFRVSVEDERNKQLSRFVRSSEEKGSKMVIQAPMPGLVIEIAIKEGERIGVGNGLLVLEAMKMENEIRSQVGGTVEKIHIIPGQTVEKGTPLLTISL
jgi:biotin carboxyl carrier protein